MKRLTTILAAVAIILSCAERTTSDGIRVIDADLTGKKVTDILLAEQKTLPLEFSEESIIGRIEGIVQTEDGGYIIASSAASTHRLMQFDRSGQYLRDIGHQGRGPGEFLDVNSIFMLYDTLHVSSFYGKNILRYLITEDGYEALPSFGYENLKWGISGILATGDIPDRYFVKNTYNGTPGWNTPLFTVYDHDWNIVDTCMTPHQEGGFNAPFPISHAGDKVYLSQIFVDTIFVADRNGIRPAFRLDFGKSDYPADIKYDVMKRYEYIQKHPDSRYLLHNASLVTDDKAYLCLLSARALYLMVYDINGSKSSFYRILDEDGEPAGLYWMFRDNEGKVMGVFTSARQDNPVICDLSAL